MLRRLTSPALLFVVLSLAIARPVSAQTDMVTVTWDPSPPVDEVGRALPPAVRYEVWVKEDRNDEYLAATVPTNRIEFPVQAGVTYRFSVRGVGPTGALSEMSQQSKPYRAKKNRTLGLNESKPVGAFPNPFNPMTRIMCLVPEDLPANAPLRLEIYDLRGQRLHEFPVPNTPGEVAFDWYATDASGRTLPAGIYLVHFQAGTTRNTSKISLVK